ncbi:MAG: glycosyltransferase 87 family protein [Candidatus Limnocylindrales bacterium]
MTELVSSGTVGPGQVAWWSDLRDRLPRVPTSGVVVAGVAWLAIVILARPDGGLLRTGQEAFCYWFASMYAPYAHSDWTQPVAYVYSPAFLQVIAPLTELPWMAFIGLWTALLLLAVLFLTGPRLFALGILLASVELVGGNISLLLAVAIVVGFRWPAAWALVLLTKVTPGIGLLWFAVRGEWRSLGIALGATAAVAAVSYVMMPWAWADWVSVLTSVAGRNGTWAAVPVPLLVRLPMAIAIVVWGARTDRRWTVPVASMLALPALWYGGLSMLLAVIVLQREPWKSARPGDATLASNDVPAVTTAVEPVTASAT